MTSTAQHIDEAHKLPDFVSLKLLLEIVHQPQIPSLSCHPEDGFGVQRLSFLMNHWEKSTCFPQPVRGIPEGIMDGS
jgi:hypothetical protein